MRPLVPMQTETKIKTLITFKFHGNINGRAHSIDRLENSASIFDSRIKQQNKTAEWKNMAITLANLSKSG